MRRIWLIASLLAAGAVVESAGSATKGATLSLVGYSTPKTVMGKIVQGWQGTPDGNGVSFNQSYAGSTDQEAVDYVTKLCQHVVSQDTSGRNATNTFLSGKGDVLLTYESEAINSRLNGTDVQYVIPRQTMLIQLPIAVLKSSPNKDLANKFIRYTKTDGP